MQMFDYLIMIFTQILWYIIMDSNNPIANVTIILIFVMGRDLSIFILIIPHKVFTISII